MKFHKKHKFYILMHFKTKAHISYLALIQYRVQGSIGAGKEKTIMVFSSLEIYFFFFFSLD